MRPSENITNLPFEIIYTRYTTLSLDGRPQRRIGIPALPITHRPTGTVLYFQFKTNRLSLIRRPSFYARLNTNSFLPLRVILQISTTIKNEVTTLEKTRAMLTPSGKT